eukprot:TRINITY_DN48542_c0_g1_i1.p1 TRINITY_DN48542_c0_g1~~TRINITY_DN48542_c0_g1_i1.p1  ORF type:complete len:614 (+),score=66.73 TRINITY_DN48542_c0_g1_i1:24-1844(+)
MAAVAMPAQDESPEQRPVQPRRSSVEVAASGRHSSGSGNAGRADDCTKGLLAETLCFVLACLGWEAACGVADVRRLWRSAVDLWLSHLTKLALHDYRASDVVVGSVIPRCPNLRELKLIPSSEEEGVDSDPRDEPLEASELYEFTDASIEVVSEACQRLEVLHVEMATSRYTYNPGLTYKGLETIAANCRQLRSLLWLVERGVSAFSDEEDRNREAFLAVARCCTQLVGIRLSWKFPDGFLKSFVQQRGSNLRTLQCFDMSFVARPADARRAWLQYLLAACPHLETLRLGDVDSNMLSDLAAHATPWRDLDLAWLADVVDVSRGLSCLFQAQGSLQGLSLLGGGIDMDCMCSLFQSCRNLARLSLWSDRQGLEAVAQAISRYPALQLRCLHLDHDHETVPADVLLPALAVCKSLEDLRLRNFCVHCPLKLIAASCGGLQKLVFTGIVQALGAGQGELSEVHVRCLRELHLVNRSRRGEGGFGVGAVRSIAESLPRLEVLKIELRKLCAEETASVIRLLRDRMHRLRTLRLHVSCGLNSKSIALFHNGFKQLQKLDVGMVEHSRSDAADVAALCLARPLLRITGCYDSDTKMELFTSECLSAMDFLD